MTKEELFQKLSRKFGSAKWGKGWINFPCPTCAPKDANKMKRGVNLATLRTSCFICSVPLTMFDLLGDVPFDRVTGDNNVIPVESEHPQARVFPCKHIVPINQLSQEHPAVKFLYKDHLFDLDRYWNDYQIGFITAENSDTVTFEKADGSKTFLSSADSIIFPVYYKGELVGWQCRFIPGTRNGDRMTKMKYLHVFRKGRYVFNYDKAKQYKNVVAVEGIKKALKFPNGVATLGKNITPVQIQTLLNWERITLMMDGDDKTQETFKILESEINKNANKICVNINPSTYGFPSPDEMSKEIAAKIVYTEWQKKLS